MAEDNNLGQTSSSGGTRRASYRATVEPAINGAGLNVVARPTAVAPPGRTYRPEPTGTQQLIGKAINGLTQLVAQEAQKASQKQAEERFRAGQALRITATEEMMADRAGLLKDRGEDFVRGYDYQDGMARGAERSAAMLARVKENPDAYPLMSVLRGEMSTLLQEDVKGMSDAGTQGYLESMARAEPNIRAEIAGYNEIVSQQKVADDWVNAWRHNLQTEAASGRSVADLQATYEAAMEMADITGVPREVANKQFITLATNVAIDTGRTDVFDLFDMSHADVNDPTKTIPGLANSSKYHDIIHDAKYQVATALAKKRGDANEQAKWNGMKNIDALMASGNFAEARLQNDKYVEDGTYKSGTASSYKTKIDKAEAAYQEKQTIFGYIASGGDQYIDIYPGMTKEKKVDYYNSFYMEGMKSAAETGDEDIIGGTYDKMVQLLSRQGVVIPALKGSLNATPGDPAAFARGYAVWSELDKRDSAYARRYISETQLDQYRMFQDALQSSSKADEALALVQRYGTKEALDEGKRRIGWVRHDIQNYVDEHLTPDAKTTGWNMDAGNVGYEYSWVERRARTIALGSGGAYSDEKLFELAVKDFKDTHSTLEVPGSGEVIWVRNSEGRWTDEDKAAVADLSETLKGKYPEGDRNYDPSGYFIQPDQYGRLLVYKAEDRMPVIENGGIVTLSSVKGLTQQYRAKQELSPEEAAKVNEQKREAMKVRHMPRHEREAYIAERNRKEKQAVIDREFDAQQSKREADAALTRQALEAQQQKTMNRKPPEAPKKRTRRRRGGPRN